VHKLQIDAGFTCPNRTKKERKGGCFWCDPYGSGPENQMVIGMKGSNLKQKDL